MGNRRSLNRPIVSPSAAPAILAAIPALPPPAATGGPGPARPRFALRNFGRFRVRDRAPGPDPDGSITLPGHDDAPGFWGPWRPAVFVVRPPAPKWAEATVTSRQVAGLAARMAEAKREDFREAKKRWRKARR